MKRSIIAILTLLLIIALSDLPVSAQGIPSLPHAFYGTVTIGGSPAPAGTKVEAKGTGVINNVTGNPLTTIVAGVYGGQVGLAPKLVVQGNIADGATIEFFINGVKANETAIWHSGQTSILNLTTGAQSILPAVQTSSVTAITITSATLNGNLTGLGTSTSVDVLFEWGTTVNYGSITAAQAKTAPGAFSAPLTGLLPGVLYHFRAKADARRGVEATGTEMTFITGAVTPPAVVTDNTTGVTTTSVTFNGNLTNPGTAASVVVSFEWGTTPGGPYPSSGGTQPKTIPGAFTISLSGFTPGTTYYFRAKADGDVHGVTYGVEKSFITTGVPLVGGTVGGGSGGGGGFVGGGGGSGPPAVVAPPVITAPPPAAAPAVPTSEDIKRSIEVQPPQVTASQLASAPLQDAAKAIQEAPAAKSAEVIAQMAPAAAARVVEQVATGKAVEILDEMPGSKAALVMEQVGTAKAAQIIGQASNAKAADTLTRMAVEKAGQAMERLPATRLEQMLPAMTAKSLQNRLPALSPSAQFALKPQVVFQALPQAPTEQLVGELPPTPGKGLEKPTLTNPTITLAVYTTEARSGEFSVLVGSPVPVDKIMAKFKQTLTGVQVELEQLAIRPPHIQPEPPGERLNTYLRIDLSQNAARAVEVGYIRFRVAKSWLTANNIHKWSVLLSRYDAEINSWMLLPTKRVDEDITNVYYSATTPKFSVFAISGSTDVPEREFDISGLEVTPAQGIAGLPIKVTADIVNLARTSRNVVVPLWVNGTVETSQAVALGAGAKARVTYTLSKAPGNYEIRLDRQITSIQVSPSTAAPIIPPSLSISISGGSGKAAMDDKGTVMEDAKITSTDGRVTLSINAGTKALKKDGKPVDAIISRPSGKGTELKPSEGKIVIGQATDFGPDGASFDPPLELALSYAGEQLPAGVTEDKLAIAYRDGTEWVKVDGKIDRMLKTVTAPIGHFTLFAVIALVPPTAPPVPSPAPKPAATLAPTPAPVPQPVVTPAPMTAPIPASGGRPAGIGWAVIGALTLVTVLLVITLKKRFSKS